MAARGRTFQLAFHCTVPVYKMAATLTSVNGKNHSRARDLRWWLWARVAAGMPDFHLSRFFFQFTFAASAFSLGKLRIATSDFHIMQIIMAVAELSTLAEFPTPQMSWTLPLLHMRLGYCLCHLRWNIKGLLRTLRAKENTVHLRSTDGHWPSWKITINR